MNNPSHGGQYRYNPDTDTVDKIEPDAKPAPKPVPVKPEPVKPHKPAAEPPAPQP